MAKMVTMGRYALTARWGPELRACRSVELSYQVVSSGVFQGTHAGRRGKDARWGRDIRTEADHSSGWGSL